MDVRRRASLPAFDDEDERVSLHIASSTLFDVVLLAGGFGDELEPLTDTSEKALIPLCNRPLIWCAVKPWLDAGVRHMFICAPSNVLQTLKLELESSTDFDGADFTFLKVTQHTVSDNASVVSGMSTASGGHSGGTADALRAYRAHKRSLPPTNPMSAPRDVLAVSCDTMFAGVSIWSFVRNFYDSAMSAAAVYYEPHKARDTSAAIPDCLGVEQPLPSSSSRALHLRVHHVESAAESSSSMSLPAGAVARRPHLTFTTGFVNAHIYLLRNWVLDLVEYDTELASIRQDVFPALAFKQLPFMGSHHGIKLPSGKLETPAPIPVPPALCDSERGGSFSVSRLNSVRHVLPPEWDELRTCVTVFPASDDARIMRVDSIHAYRSFTREVLSGLTKPDEASSLSKMLMPYLRYETARTVAAAQSDDEIRTGVNIKYSGILSCPPDSAKVAVSVISKNVEIGHNVSLRNCILLQGSRVADGVKLQDVLVCANQEVTEDCEGVVIAEGRARDFRDFAQNV